MTFNPHDPILPPPTPKGPYQPAGPWPPKRKPVRVTAHLTVDELIAALQDYFGFPETAEFRFKVDTVSFGPMDSVGHKEFTGVDITYVEGK